MRSLLADKARKKYRVEHGKSSKTIELYDLDIELLKRCKEFGFNSQADMLHEAIKSLGIGGKQCESTAQNTL